MATAFGKAIRVLFVSLIYVFIYQLMQVLTEVAAGLGGVYRVLPAAKHRILSVFSDTVMSKLYICLILSMLLALAAYWAIGLLRERKIRSELSFRRPNEMTAAAAIVLGLGCRLLVSVYTNIAEDIPVLKNSAEQRMEMLESLMTPVNILLALVWMILLAPVFEEILFRGLVQTELMRGFPPAAAIVIGALIFGGAHGLLYQSAFTFFVGLALGWCYYITKNLFLTMVIHVVFNATAAVSGLLMTAGPLLIVPAALIGVALTVISCVMIYQGRQIKAQQ